MKILFAALLFAVPVHAEVNNLLSSIEDSRSYYNKLLEDQRTQMAGIQKLYDEMWDKTQQLADSKAYTNGKAPGRGVLQYQIQELQVRINERASTLDVGQARVKIGSHEIRSRVEAARTRYMQVLRSASVMDEAGLKNLNLSAETLQDVRFMQKVKDLSPESFDKRLKIYEARNFGWRPTRNAELIGLKPSRTGDVKVNTYADEHQVRIHQNQIIRLRTASGAIVQGRVHGILEGELPKNIICDGIGSTAKGNKVKGQFVMMDSVYPDDIDKVIPAKGRTMLVDLSQVQAVSIYEDNASFVDGRPKYELEPRFGYDEINDGIRSGYKNMKPRRGSQGAEVARAGWEDKTLDRGSAHFDMVRSFGSMGESLGAEIGGAFGAGSMH